MDDNTNSQMMDLNEQPLSQELPSRLDLSPLDHPPLSITIRGMYWKHIVEVSNGEGFKGQLVDQIIDTWNFLIKWNEERVQQELTPEYLDRNPIAGESFTQPDYNDWGHLAYALAIPLDWFTSDLVPAVGFERRAVNPAIIRPLEGSPEKKTLEYVARYWTEARLEGGGSEWLWQSNTYRSGNSFARAYASHIVYYDNHRPSLPMEAEGSQYYGWMRIALAAHFLNWIRDVLFCHLGSSRALITSALLQSDRFLKMRKMRGVNPFISESPQLTFTQQSVCRTARRHAGLYGTVSLLNANGYHLSGEKVISAFYQNEHFRIGELLENTPFEEFPANETEYSLKFEPKHKGAFDICARLLFESCRQVQHEMAWAALYNSKGPFPIGGVYVNGWRDAVPSNWRVLTPGQLFDYYKHWEGGECNDTSGCGEFTRFFSVILGDLLPTLYSKSILSPMDPEILRINLDLFPSGDDSLCDLCYVRPSTAGIPVSEEIDPGLLSEQLCELDFSSSVFKLRDPIRYKGLLQIHNDTCNLKQRYKPY